MNVVLFGASGMVGQGVLLACLADPGIANVVSVGRRPLAAVHEKLSHIVHEDFLDYFALENRLRDADACFYCLGVSAAGMGEEAYRRVTHDYTLAAAKALARLNSALAFCYVSGAGTDTTEKSRMMWARVKGRTENELLALFPNAYMFRPGYIQPTDGIESSTRSYRLFYRAFGFLYPAFEAVAPNLVTTTARFGRAMIATVRTRGPSRVIEMPEINALGA
jgi:uncharacterized protein YbjT (DUF2867 family)